MMDTVVFCYNVHCAHYEYNSDFEGRCSLDQPQIAVDSEGLTYCVDEIIVEEDDGEKGEPQ